MALTIDQIKQVSIPSNLWRNNNLALSNVSPYNKAVNLYYAVLAILDEQGTAGDTNLGASQATTTTTITSSTGTDVVILGANNTRSGVMTAAQADNLTNLVTLSGVAANSAHLGTFTGTTIADSSTIKAALQSLETALEAVASESSQDAVGSILTDSSTIDFTYNDATPSITASIIDDSVTFAKIQNIATNKLLGRSTASTGNIEEITIGSGLQLSGGSLSTTGGSGTVTSVDITVPTIFGVTGNPITSSGTLAITLDSQASNLVLAGPSSGASTTPTFRALVADDIPSLTTSKISDFTENLQDQIATFLVEGSGITLTYDDSGNTLTIEAPASGYTTENAQDDIGSILVDSGTIDFTYNDSTPSITAGVKSNSISNTNLTSGTGGIYKGSGTIASGAAATVTSSSTFRINYSSTDPGITVDDVDESTTIYSGSGSNYVYANNDNVEIVAGKGLIIPKISGAARDAIASPTAGAFIYNTTTNKLNFYNGSTWEVVTSS